MENKPSQRIRALPPYAWIGAWLAIGAGMGTAIHNIPVGAGIGIIIGAGIAFTFYMLNKRESE
jgi:hypothetical protein